MQHRLKFTYREIVLIVYLLGLISFLFIKCQEITSQEIAACSVMLVIPFVQKIIYSKGEFKRVCICMLLFMLFETIRSIYRYGQGVGVVLYLSIEFVSILLYLYFSSFSQEKKDRLYSIILWFSRFELACMWVVVLIYNFVGYNLLDEVNVGLRNGRARVYNGAFLMIVGGILTLSRMIKNGNNGEKIQVREWNYLLFLIIFLLYGCQSRLLIVATLGTFIVMYGLGYKKASKKILVLMAVILGTIIVSFVPAVQNYIGVNFGKIFDGTDSSVIPRSGAIEHYIEYGSQEWIIGWGFMSFSAPSNGVYDIPFLTRGPWGVYYTNDLGIIGSFMQFGVVGIGIYIFILIKALRIGFIEKKNNIHKLGIAIFLVITALTGILYDTERQSYIPLMLLCMEMNVGTEVRKICKKTGEAT